MKVKVKVEMTAEMKMMIKKPQKNVAHVIKFFLYRIITKQRDVDVNSDLIVKNVLVTDPKKDASKIKRTKIW